MFDIIIVIINMMSSLTLLLHYIQLYLIPISIMFTFKRLVHKFNYLDLFVIEFICIFIQLFSRDLIVEGMSM